VLSHSVVSNSDPMDCSLPGSSVHGDSPGRRFLKITMLMPTYNFLLPAPTPNSVPLTLQCCYSTRGCLPSLFLSSTLGSIRLCKMKQTRSFYVRQRDESCGKGETAVSESHVFTVLGDHGTGCSPPMDLG